MSRMNRLAPHGGIRIVPATGLLVATALILLLAAGPASAQDGAVLQPAAAPASLFCGEATDVTWTYTPDGPGTPALRGYSVNVVAPPGLNFTAADVTVLSPLGGVNDTHFIVENDLGDVTIDFIFLDPGVGLSAAADLFTVTMTSDAHGAPTVGTTAAGFRDLSNQAITVVLGDTGPLELDCTAPDVPDLDPEPEFTAGTTNTVSWSDESGSGAATYNVQASTDGSFTVIADESGWITGLSHEFTGLADGTTYFYRVASRNGQDVSAGYSAFASSTQDAIAPVTFAGAPGATVYTTTFEVPVIFADAVSGPGTIELFYNYEGGPWLSAGVFPGDQPALFASTNGDGTYNFYTQGTDAAGNLETVTPAVQASTTLDTTAPFATFTINGGVQATNNTAVTLTIDFERVNEMRFSNDNATWPEGWIPVTSPHPWTIDAVAGVRTVYGEFRQAGVTWFAQATIEYDTTPTAPATAADAAPGHEAVNVTWTPPADADWDRVEIWRGLVKTGGGQSAYPSYLNPIVPSPPASRAAALADPAWVLAGESASQAANFTDAVTERGIYHYALFAMDEAGNYSAPSAANPAATNYLLGDIGLPYDGGVGVFDLTVLGAAYGASIIYPEFNAEADFAPTDDATGTGLPQPDQLIDFEDLQIASVNYTPGSKSGTAASGTHARTALLAWRETGPGVWDLELREPCPSLKGLRIAADLPAGVAATVSRGPLLANQPGPVFLQNIPRLGLDAGLSALGRGTGFTGRGVLLTVTLPEGADPAVLSPDRLTLVVRDVDNHDLAFEIDGKSSRDLPLAFGLGGAHPNPFNPLTTIAFTLPGEMDVKLEIYGLDGRRVAVLVDGKRGPGRHEAVWEGRDDTGRPVASGVYFTRLTSGALSRVGKMTLMK